MEIKEKGMKLKVFQRKTRTRGRGGKRPRRTAKEVRGIRREK